MPVCFLCVPHCLTSILLILALTHSFKHVLSCVCSIEGGVPPHLSASAKRGGRGGAGGVTAQGRRLPACTGVWLRHPAPFLQHDRTSGHRGGQKVIIYVPIHNTHLNYSLRIFPSRAMWRIIMGDYQLVVSLLSRPLQGWGQFTINLAHEGRWI